MEDDSNKVLTSEMVLGNIFCLGLDLVCAVVETVSVGAAAVITPFVQGFVVFNIEKWLEKKGGKSQKIGKRIAKQALGILPILPTTTVIFNIDVILHNKLNTSA